MKGGSAARACVETLASGGRRTHRQALEVVALFLSGRKRDPLGLTQHRMTDIGALAERDVPALDQAGDDFLLCLQGSVLDSLDET